MKKSQRKLLKLFKEKNWENKPNLTWEEIGQLIELSGEGARGAWKRYRQEEKALSEAVEEYVDNFEARVTEKPVEIVEIEPVKLNKSHFTKEGIHVVSGCWHVPFADKQLVAGFMELLQDLGDKVVSFHLAGDFLDLNSLSSHDKGKFTAIPGLSLTDEYAAGNVILDQIDAILPKDCEKSYLWGNHCFRAKRWMGDMQNAKTPIPMPTEALKLYERGYNVHENWDNDYIKLGDHLMVLHGIYWNQYSAKKHLDVLRTSCLYYHTHRIQSYVEGNHAAFNGGFMGDLKSPAFNYASMGMKSQWQNGFNLVYVDSKGDFFMQQIIVCNGKFVYGNKIY